MYVSVYEHVYVYVYVYVYVLVYKQQGFFYWVLSFFQVGENSQNIAIFFWGNIEEHDFFSSKQMWRTIFSNRPKWMDVDDVCVFEEVHCRYPLVN